MEDVSYDMLALELDMEYFGSTSDQSLALDLSYCLLTPSSRQMRWIGQIKCSRNVLVAIVIKFALDGNKLPTTGGHGLFSDLGTNYSANLSQFGLGEAGILEQDLGKARCRTGSLSLLGKYRWIVHGKDDSRGGNNRGAVMEQIMLLQCTFRVEIGCMSD